MSTHNSNLRELAQNYKKERCEVAYEFDKRQHQLSRDIDLARNDRSYWLTMVKIGENLEQAKAKIDELTERIAQLHIEKTELDHARRTKLLFLEQNYHADVNRIEDENEKGGAKS